MRDLGFAKGNDENEAFKNLIEENQYLLNTSFNELIHIELKNEDYYDKARYFFDFASKISFLEFIQDEFKPAKIPLDQLASLKPKKLWNIDELSEFVKNYPKSFIIFEQVFQLSRFTNAQLIHFIFDVGKLNSLNINAIYIQIYAFEPQKRRKIQTDIFKNN